MTSAQTGPPAPPRPRSRPDEVGRCRSRLVESGSGVLATPRADSRPRTVCGRALTGTHDAALDAARKLDGEPSDRPEPTRVAIVQVVFSPEDRNQLKDELVSRARGDARIDGTAFTGSSAGGNEDRWSDIDLALSVAADRDETMADWTAWMYETHGAAHHLDVARAGAVYRVFLLSSSLQVDLSFWPEGQLRSTGPAFRLLFGEARDPSPSAAPEPSKLIGLGWLYALHARSSIARRRVWQAEYMISGARDHVLALACLRRGLPAAHGRGIDELPQEVTARLAPTLARSLEVPELQRAFAALVDALLREAEESEPSLGQRLASPLTELVR